MTNQHSPEIHLLTGPVQTGKTTRLREWCARAARRGDIVDGILAPVVNGRRHLLHIASGEMRDLEDLSGGATAVTVRRFTFNAEVFAWARDRLLVAALGEPVRLTGGNAADARGATAPAGRVAAPRWVIVDEVGPLELRGEGLEPAVTKLVNAAREAPPGPAENAAAPLRIVLVIREELVEKALAYLGVEQVRAF